MHEQNLDEHFKFHFTHDKPHSRMEDAVRALCRVITRLCAVRRISPFSRAGVSGAPRRAGTAVRNDSDADVIYHLNRTRLLVIGTES